MSFTVYSNDCMNGDCKKCGFGSSSFYKCPLNATEDEESFVKFMLWDYEKDTGKCDDTVEDQLEPDVNIDEKDKQTGKGGIMGKIKYFQ